MAVQALPLVGNAPPKEIAALGRAEVVAAPSPIFTIPVGQPLVLLGVGGVIFVSGLVLAAALPMRFLFVPITVACAGAAVAASPWLLRALMPQTPPTYTCYRTTLVIQEADRAVLVPWSDILEWLATDSSFATVDQRFRLSPFVSNRSPVIGRLHDALITNQLPPALAQLEAGSVVHFGEFAVSRTSLDYRGDSIPWEKVSGIIFNVTQQAYVLTIKGSLMPRSLPITGTPNHWVLMAVISRACPKHLKVAEQA